MVDKFSFPLLLLALLYAFMSTPSAHFVLLAVNEMGYVGAFRVLLNPQPNDVFYCVLLLIEDLSSAW